MSSPQGIQRPAKLTYWESVILVYAIARTISAGIFTLLLSPFRDNTGSRRLKNHVILTMIRAFVRPTPNRIIQYVHGSLHDLYPAYAKKEGFEPKWETMPSGLRAYWFGDPKAEKVIIFFHGGGYSLAPNPAHPVLATLITKTQPSLAVLMPAYALTPHGTYPTQLRQATETLHHVLHTLNRAPSAISIGGDSAGGNLSLGLISHLLHPHPELPKLDLPRGQALKAAILISPWVSFDTTTESIRRNANKDLVTTKNGNEWSAAFLGTKAKDEWNEPARAGVGWWEGIEKVVGEVLVTAGGDEGLVDGIRDVTGKLEAKHPKVTYVEAEGEWHEKGCQPEPQDGEHISRDAILAFCGSRL